MSLMIHTFGPEFTLFILRDFICTHVQDDRILPPHLASDRHHHNVDADFNPNLRNISMDAESGFEDSLACSSLSQYSSQYPRRITSTFFFVHFNIHILNLPNMYLPERPSIPFVTSARLTARSSPTISDSDSSQWPAITSRHAVDKGRGRDNRIRPDPLHTPP